MVAVADLMAGGALAATYTGLVGSRHGSGSAGAPARVTAPVARRVSSAAASADYAVDASSYRLVVAARSRCWVQVVDGGRATYAAVMPAGHSRSFSVTGGSRVELGSAGGSVTVSTGGRSQRLTPPAAPYTFNFTPA